jgi:Domain of unknown function (DUF5668)
MNCVNHADAAAVAYCRACGKALCEACQRTAQGTIFCEEHMPAQSTTGNPQAAYSPYTAPPGALATPPLCAANLSVSPGLAFLLGFIPGVGAIYNGQYAKGLVHVLILGILISIVSSGATAGGFEPLFGIMIMVWFAYMAFEAYHTAKRRQLGQPVDEFSSLVPLKGSGRFPVAPVLFIALGVLFLLMNFELLHFRDVIRYWPVFLIALGVYMLYVRLTGQESGSSIPPGASEVFHERQ